MEHEVDNIDNKIKEVCLKDVKDNDIPDTKIVFAISDFAAREGSEQLSFKKAQCIHILHETNNDWWWAEIDGNHGYVPVNHLTTKPCINWQDEEYFGNYGNLKLHHEMLSDRPRTLAYMNAIMHNSKALKDKVILDVGCGTGILSMLCAKHAQPKQVYSVEASDMAVHTKSVVRHNNMADVITVIHGYAEEVTLPQPVDLIISEWMGTMLLFEMMIESVILMRDKYLTESGIIWPSQANLILAPCVANQQYTGRVDFWNHQYGLDFSCFKPVAKADLLSRPFHNYTLPTEDCLSAGQTILSLDMKTVTIDDLETQACPFQFVVSSGEVMHGFCTWFEVEFCPLDREVDTVRLNTGPDHDSTHWKQNLFLLDDPILVSPGDVVKGTVTMTRNAEYRRHLHAKFDFTVSHQGERKSEVTKCEKLFYIWR